MRIDDENKVVWCSEVEMEWYVSLNHSFGNHYSVDVKRIAELSCENGERLPFELSLFTRYSAIKSITSGYTFKLEQPQKYYWRKKKEHLAWFEEEVYLTRFKFSDNENYCYVLGSKNGSLKNTEQQARKILKDDFDKFEKVECE